MRRLSVLAVVFAAAVSAGCARQSSTNQAAPIAAAPATAPDAAPGPDVVGVNTTNAIGDQTNMIDQLVFFETADEFRAGEMKGLSMATEAGASQSPPIFGKQRAFEDAWLYLDPAAEKDFPQRGSFTTREVVTAFPFTELLPSWNATVPDRSGVFFEARVRLVETGEWSPWLYMGAWGHLVMPPTRTIKFDHGKVEVDVLLLDKPADAYQLRAQFRRYDFDPNVSPALHRLACVTSGRVDDPAERARLDPPPAIVGDWARSLPVPFRPQGIEDPSIKGSICSPTSTSMVMAYHGVSLPTLDNALAIYDPNYGIFGNWARAVQYAANNGLAGYLDRFRTWDEVKALIAQGQPVIASIRFDEGTFPSNVMKETDGHLIVVRGFTKDGDAIVNDPASKDRGEAIVYKADELANAWFGGSGGVGYVITKRDGWTTVEGQ